MTMPGLLPGSCLRQEEVAAAPTPATRVAVAAMPTTPAVPAATAAVALTRRRVGAAAHRFPVPVPPVQETTAVAPRPTAAAVLATGVAAWRTPMEEAAAKDTTG